MKGPLFYSKILLFGEYGIIQDSKGLSIPYNFYNGALKTDGNKTDEAIKSNQSLHRFATYLTQANAPYKKGTRLKGADLIKKIRCDSMFVFHINAIKINLAAAQKTNSCRIPFFQSTFARTSKKII